MIGRRESLRGSALGMGGLLISRYALAASAASTDSRIEILLDEPLGAIAPEIYGHFTENVGGLIYDGIWVGENSKVPNIGGIRKQLVEEMRQIKPPVVRCLGGCFADHYDWRNGIGPVSNRPRVEPISRKALKRSDRLAAINTIRIGLAQTNSFTSAD